MTRASHAARKTRRIYRILLLAISVVLIVEGLGLLVWVAPLAQFGSWVLAQVAAPAPLDDSSFVNVDPPGQAGGQPDDESLPPEMDTASKSPDASQPTREQAERDPAQAPVSPVGGPYTTVCSTPGCSAPPPARSVGANSTDGQTGVSASYVPPGALSVSAARRVRGKYYPPGSFEYLHGLFHVPFELPDVSKASVKLPPAVAAGLCPLTGLPLASPALASRRPLNVRVDNSPAARPQSGLSQADIVFETLAEGGITRFTAVYLCTPDAVPVGPIRSARLIDLQLAPMFKAILVHAGASAPVEDMIWSSEVGDAEFDPILRDSPGFSLVPWRVAPHNVYANTGTLWDMARRTGLNGPVDLQGLSFDANAPAGGSPVRAVRVPYSDASLVGYTYADGSFSKTIDGAVHADLGTGQALRFANVIVLFAKETITPIVEDSEGAHSLHFDVQRQGRALLFRDGQMYDARWLREGRNILFHFVDARGNSLPLKPGTTIVNIAPLDLRVAVAR